MSQIAKCIACGNDFEAKRIDAKLCSMKCRQSHSRRGDKDRIGENIPSTPVVSTTLNRWGEDVTTLGPQELYIRINLYPGVTWKTSPEYAELMKRLKEKSVEELKDQGYFIPTWKEARPSMNKEKE